MCDFYTTEIKTLWTGYMNSIAYSYKGVLVDLEFDLYEK